MSQVDAFQITLQKTGEWLRDIRQLLEWESDQRAYLALRAVLHTLRDRLPVVEAVHLGSQLPMLVRGFYYEGWRPHGKPLKERHKEEFLAHVAAAFRVDFDADSEDVTQGVCQVLAKHLTGGEIEHVKSSLPAEIRSLWA